MHKPWNKEQMETNMVLTLTLSDFQERPKKTFTFQNMFFLHGHLRILNQFPKPLKSKWFQHRRLANYKNDLEKNMHFASMVSQWKTFALLEKTKLIKKAFTVLRVVPQEIGTYQMYKFPRTK